MDFDALESQFSEEQQQQALQGTRKQAEMAAAFHHKLREQNVGRVAATIITASMLQSFIIATIMKPDS